MERFRLKAVRKNKRAGRLLRKMDREFGKRQSNLLRVLAWQKEAAKLMSQALEDMQKRKDKRKKLKRFEISKPSESETEVNFVLEKVPERHLRKYGADSCVY